MLRFSYEPGCPDDRGWVVHRTSVWKDDREVGYLKVSYIPKAEFRRIYKDAWQFSDRILGRYPLHGSDDTKPPAELTLEFAKFRRFHVDKPLVDYIRVYEEHRRQKIGLALYTHVARQLAEEGFPLYASGIQSEAAQAVWAYMREHDFPIRVVRGPYNKSRVILDYRIPRH